MTFTPTDIARLCWQTLTDPAVAARRVLSLGLGLGHAGEAIVLVAALNVVMAGILQFVMPVAASGAGAIQVTPFGYMAIMIGAMILVAVMVLVSGQLFGGTGRFEDALVLVAWLEFVAIGVALAQSLALLLMPPLGVIVFYAGLGALFWAMVNFVNVLHGFDNRAKAAMAFVLGVFVLGIALGVVLSVFNIAPVIGAT